MSFACARVCVQYVRLGSQSLLLNGIPLDVNSLDIFNVYKLLKSEAVYVDQLKDIVQSHTVTTGNKEKKEGKHKSRNNKNKLIRDLLSARIELLRYSVCVCVCVSKTVQNINTS